MLQSKTMAFLKDLIAEEIHILNKKVLNNYQMKKVHRQAEEYLQLMMKKFYLSNREVKPLLSSTLMERRLKIL